MSGELFQITTGVKLIHVPYRGAAPATSDLLGGQVQVLFSGPPAVIDHIRAGSLRALAVTTPSRSDALPGVPTMGDFVPGYEATHWYAVALRESTDDKTITRLADLGMMPFPSSSADLTKFVADEMEKWGKVIRTANIKPE